MRREAKEDRADSLLPKRCSEIAPAAPHVQHMPSHIFTRVGYWKESIGSNADSVRSAKASNEAHDQLHAMDYLVYAYLQMREDAKANERASRTTPTS